MPFLCSIQSFFFPTFLQSGMFPWTFSDPNLAVFFVSHCMLLVLPSSHQPSTVKRTLHVVTAMSKGFGPQQSGSGFEFHLHAGTYIRCVHRSVQTDLPSNWLYKMCEDCSLGFGCGLNLAPETSDWGGVMNRPLVQMSAQAEISCVQLCN
jgi:hypothetical protein